MLPEGTDRTGREGTSNLGESSAPYSITWSARQISRLRPFQDLVDVLGRTAKHVGQTRSVRHQDASLRRFLERDNRGEAILDGDLSELCSFKKEDWRRQTEQSARALSDRGLHRRVEAVRRLAKLEPLDLETCLPRRRLRLSSSIRLAVNSG